MATNHNPLNKDFRANLSYREQSWVEPRTRLAPTESELHFLSGRF